MNIVYMVIGIHETRLVTEVMLSSSGIDTESKHYLIGGNCGEYNTYDEALIEAEKISAQYDYMEVKPLFKSKIF